MHHSVTLLTKLVFCDDFAVTSSVSMADDCFKTPIRPGGKTGACRKRNSAVSFGFIVYVSLSVVSIFVGVVLLWPYMEMSLWFFSASSSKLIAEPR